MTSLTAALFLSLLLLSFSFSFSFFVALMAAAAAELDYITESLIMPFSYECAEEVKDLTPNV